jgi:hypothetical protein
MSQHRRQRRRLRQLLAIDPGPRIYYKAFLADKAPGALPDHLRREFSTLEECTACRRLVLADSGALRHYRQLAALAGVTLVLLCMDCEALRQSLDEGRQRIEIPATDYQLLARWRQWEAEKN